jgi:hypothetical protein
LNFGGAKPFATCSRRPGQGRDWGMRQLSCLSDRVAYQRAIEEVYWRHRIWPKERPDPKPSLDAVMSQATIEQKVQDYLRNSELLEQSGKSRSRPSNCRLKWSGWRSTPKQPEVLRELFAALGNDPFVIAECLARPVLSERLQFATLNGAKNRWIPGAPERERRCLT